MIPRRCSLQLEILEDRFALARFGIITADHQLAIVNTNDPGQTQLVPVLGLPADNVISGIDQRHSDGRLFAAVDSLSNNAYPSYPPTFYTLDKTDGLLSQSSILKPGGYSMNAPKRFEFGHGSNVAGTGEGQLAYTFNSNFAYTNGGWNLYHFSSEGLLGNNNMYGSININYSDATGTHQPHPDDMASVVTDGVAWLVMLQNDRLYARRELNYRDPFLFVTQLPATTSQRLIDGDTAGNLYLMEHSPDHDARISTLTLTSPTPVLLTTVPLRGTLGGFTTLQDPTNPNRPPRVHLPDALHALEDTPFVFSTANHTALTISDDATGDLPVSVSLTFALRNGAQVYSGRYTLATTQGLTFQLGDGTNDDFMTFTGLLSDVNRALDGMFFTTDPNFFALDIPDQPHIIVNDLGSGLGSQQATMKTLLYAVDPANDPPVAIADLYYMSSNTSMDLDVGQNDFEQNPDGRGEETLRVVEVLNNTNGATITIDNDSYSLHYRPRPGFHGTDQFQYRIAEPSGLTAVGEVTVVVGRTPFLASTYVVGGVTTLGLMNVDMTQPFIEFRPFGYYSGPVSVAIADIDGDGIEDIVAAKGKGGGELSVFTQAGVPLSTAWSRVFPFGRNYINGLEIAVGDVNYDGAVDLAVTQFQAGQARVKVLNGATGATLSQFPARGYVAPIRLSLADTNDDGIVDLTTLGPNPWRGLSVKAFDPLTGLPLAPTAVVEQANRQLRFQSLIGLTWLRGGLTGYAIGIGNSFGTAEINVLVTTRDGSELAFAFTGNPSTSKQRRFYRQLTAGQYESRFVTADILATNQTAWVVAPSSLRRPQTGPIVRTYDHDLNLIEALIAGNDNPRFRRGISLALSKYPDLGL